jgi:hypothetical protein
MVLLADQRGRLRDDLCGSWPPTPTPRSLHPSTLIVSVG